MSRSSDRNLLDLTQLLNFCNYSVVKYKYDMYVIFGEYIDNDFIDSTYKKF